MVRVFNLTVVGAGLVLGTGILIGLYFLFPVKVLQYPLQAGTTKQVAAVAASNPSPKTAESAVGYLPTPKPVKALYLTSWAAGNTNLYDHVIGLVDHTEANAVVIDVKDYTGRIAFAVDNAKLKNSGVVEERIPNIKELIAGLHKKNIYVIGRISTFQDSFLITGRPDLAVKKASDKNVWRDRKGVAWLDPGSKEVWDYVVTIAKESHAVGFDELNFDYIRFPSDGNIADLAYDFYDPKAKTKAEQLTEFFKYLRQELDPLEVPLSADLFGMVTSNKDDLGIGQVLENALPYFDYVSPMVYPSHYPATWGGFKKPAEKPYEVVKLAMDLGVARAKAASQSADKIRPWLQDFDLGAIYTADMVKAQMKAVYDSGLDSWMLWDPANKYTAEALEPV